MARKSFNLIIIKWVSRLCYCYDFNEENFLLAFCERKERGGERGEKVINIDFNSCECTQQKKPSFKRACLRSLIKLSSTGDYNATIEFFFFLCCECDGIPCILINMHGKSI